MYSRIITLLITEGQEVLVLLTFAKHVDIKAKVTKHYCNIGLKRQRDIFNLVGYMPEKFAQRLWTSNSLVYIMYV